MEKYTHFYQSLEEACFDLIYNESDGQRIRELIQIKSESEMFDTDYLYEMFLDEDIKSELFPSIILGCKLNFHKFISGLIEFRGIGFICKIMERAFDLRECFLENSLSREDYVELIGKIKSPLKLEDNDTKRLRRFLQDRMAEDFVKIPDYIIPITEKIPKIDLVESFDYDFGKFEELIKTMTRPSNFEVNQQLFEEMVERYKDEEEFDEEDVKKVVFEDNVWESVPIFMSSPLMMQIKLMNERFNLGLPEFDDTLIFQVYGPSNPSKNCLECLDLGGCRMLVCNAFEDVEIYDEEYDDLEVDWFTGKCKSCSVKIPEREYAVRKPFIDGGWSGCYCSWRCCRGNSELDGMIDSFEFQCKSFGIFKYQECIQVFRK